MADEHIPTDDLRKRVKAYTAYGMPQADVCRLIGISKPTLEKHYRDELDTGAAEANASIAQVLFKKALAGDSASVFFWLKTRARWRETNRYELTGADGQPLPQAPPAQMPNIIFGFIEDEDEKEARLKAQGVQDNAADVAATNPIDEHGGD